jgi:hypothetical protein
MIKRKNAPRLQAIEKINFISPVKIQLGEHTPFFWMKEVPNETARLDFIFHAGTTRGSNLISSLVSGLLFSGTDKKTSTDIHNELFENYYEIEIIDLEWGRENYIHHKIIIALEAININSE